MIHHVMRRLPLGLAVAVAWGAVPVRAQTAAPPASAASAAVATLPAVTVKAATPQATTEGSGSYTTESTATATGLSLSVRDTPQSVSVVTRQRIDDQAMTSVADALRNTIGVSVKPADRGRNSVSARGFDVNNFQFDGVPTATGNVGIETLNTAIYDRIEIVRGATGLLNGAGDPSAAVNLVRKHADSRVFTGELSAELGSWNQRTATVDLSTPLTANGAVRARFVASVSRQDAFIDLENTRNSVVYGVIDADLTPNTRLSLGASEQRDKRNGVLWASLPYWYADGTRTDSDRSKTTATKWNQWDTVDRTAFATLSHRLSNGWVLRGDLSTHRQHEDSKLLWIEERTDRVTGLGLLGTPYHYIAEPRQTNINVAATGPFSLLGREHELHVGVMRSTLKDGWSNRDPVGPSPVALPDFNQWDGSFPEPPMGDRYLASAGKTTQSAVYGVARLQLADPLKLIVGARVSNWRRDEQAAVWTPAAYTIEHNGVVTPYAGLVYDVSPQVSAYASYTDIFKPQTSRDRNGDYLDPLEGKSYEAGLKGELLGGRLNASGAVFRTEQSNFTVVDTGFFVPGTTDPAFRTADGVVVKGYELELSGELAPGWDLAVGWTQFSAKDADGVDVAVDHSRRQLKVFSTYQLEGAWRGLSVGGGVSWEGDRPARATNPVTGLEEKVGQPAFAIAEVMARYVFSDQLSLQLNVFNLFDKKYRNGSWWGAPYTYGEPRRILVTGAYRF